MKQKIVIKVEMNDQKRRTRAMKIAAEAEGVTSVAIEGEDKSQVVVTGEEVDSACLTRSLRKKVGYATIVSVQKLEEEEKEEDNPTPISTCCQYPQFPLYYGAVSDPWPRNWCFM